MRSGLVKADGSCLATPAMKDGSTQLRHPRTDVGTCVRRLVWAALLAIHAGAAPSAVRAIFYPTDGAVDAFSILRFAGLLSAAVLCALKLLDVPWLRIRPGWRGSLSVAMGLALLHASMIPREEEGDRGLTPSHVGVFLFVGSGLHFQVARRVIRVWVAELRAARHRAALDRPQRGTVRECWFWRPAIDFQRFQSPLAARPPPQLPCAFAS